VGSSPTSGTSPTDSSSLGGVCGRYTLANPDPKRLRLRFGISESVEIGDEPRFNIAPTDPVLAVREGAGGAGRDAGHLRWGLVPGRWAMERRGRPLINARAESVATQPAFAESFRERRCLIPADGFYEWRRDEHGKVPVWVHRPDDELFAFAGIWSSFEPRSGGDAIVSCAIVTCAPNELMRPIHDRMPVILDRDREAAWLDPRTAEGDLHDVLTPAPSASLEVREVSDLVNSVREDGPELIAAREPDQTLF
jgi:putative SOS response-associated peptidase YedK